jgi:Domain of unknown function (DUF4252)
MDASILRTMRATNIFRRPAFVRSLFATVFVLAFHASQAQDFGLYWKYKDYDNAIAVSVPGWVAKLGSTFMDEKEGRRIVRKIKKVRVLVFQEGSPITERDIKRFNRKAKRRNLDELVTVREGKTRVQIYGKMRRNSIRKVVVFFHSPEDGSGLVSLRGKFNLKDIDKAINKVGKKSKNGDKPIVPPLVKIPVLKA